MKNLLRRLIKPFTLSAVLFLISACSSLPSTQYFSLVSSKESLITKNSNTTNIGIGPLFIPNSLDSYNILSIKNNNEVLINPFYLWAGNLKANINQVLADNISTNLGNDSVWGFPWDNRNRPEIQVRIVFEKFIGELGKEVNLQAKWVILSDYGKKEIVTRKTLITELVDSDDYLSYVQALNVSLHRLSLLISDELNNI